MIGARTAQRSQIQPQVRKARGEAAELQLCKRLFPTQRSVLVPFAGTASNLLYTVAFKHLLTQCGGR